MNTLAFINIIFENTESMSFTRLEIGEFHIENISTEIKRVASNAISKIQHAKTVCIELFSEGDTQYMPFGLFDGEDDAHTKFERIMQYDDITAIECHWTDGTVDTYYPHYDEGDCEGMLGADNICQISRLSSLGNLYIVISDEINGKGSGAAMLDKIFPKEVIEDECEMDFKKDMYFRIELGLAEDFPDDKGFENTENKADDNSEKCRE